MNNVTFGQAEIQSAVNVALGPPFISTAFIYGLLGMSLGQVFCYFRGCGDDKSFFKYLVQTVFCLEICHTLLITYAMYQQVIIHRGLQVLQVLQGLPGISISLPQKWTGALCSIVGALVTLVVRVFYSFRIWQLSKSYYLPMFLLLFGFCPLAFSIYTAVMIVPMGFIPGVPTLIPAGWFFYFSCGGDILSDVIIASYMVWYLRRKQANEYIFRSTSNLLNGLMIYSISTGLLAVALYATGLILVIRYNLSWDGVFMAIPHVIINSMLCAINSRERLRSQRGVQIEPHSSYLPSNGIVLEVHELVQIR